MREPQSKYGTREYLLKVRKDDLVQWLLHEEQRADANGVIADKLQAKLIELTTEDRD